MRILGVTASSYEKYSSFESIASVSPGGTDLVTFSSIPSTYKHLQIRFVCKSSYTTAELGWGNSISLSIGSATAAYNHQIYGNGANADTTYTNGGDYIKIYGTNMASLSSQTNMFSAGIIDIHDYSSTTKNKTFRAICGTDYNTGTSFAGSALNSGFINRTSAISNIYIYSAFNNFASGSSFALYGIKG